MRREIVRAVFLKELRETLRDRRSLAVMFGVPLVLYPLLTITTARLAVSTAQRRRTQPATVAIVNLEAAPHLQELARAPDSGIRVLPVENPRAALQEQKVDAVLQVPPHFEEQALQARDVRLRLEVNTTRPSASYAEDKLDRLVSRYERWIIRQRLQARGVPEAVIRPIRTVREDVTTGDLRFGSQLAGLLPTILLVTGILGAFFPAVNAITAERELGTLETLLVSPAHKDELLLGKTALVLISGLLASGLNFLSMTLVVWRTFSSIPGRAALTIDPGALALAYLAAVPTLLFFACLVMLVALFARNYKEANSYATPVMLVTLVPLLLTIAEPRPTPALLVTPVVNSCIVMREVLTGHARAGDFLLAFISSLIISALTLSAAARMFTSEQLVNPAWEPLSVRGLRAGLNRRGRRVPVVDEVVALWALSLLLLFYVTPSLAPTGLLPTLFGTEILLVAGPALLFAYFGRYDWPAVFSWRAAPATALLGAALLAVGAIPWVQLVAGLQNLVWPRDPAAAKAMEQLFGPALRDYPLLTVLSVGLSAGICEELLYRGPIQAAMVRRMRPVWALLAGAVLFGAAHLDPQGILPRGLLSMGLGWMVLRTGSILPAIVAHGVYDSSALAIATWMPQESLFKLEAAFQPLGGSPAALAAQLAVGAALAAVGFVLVARSRKLTPVSEAQDRQAPAAG